MSPVQALLSRLTAVFGEPFGDMPELFFHEYHRVLAIFSAETLQAAGDEIIAKHVGPSRWPKPADVARVCQEIEKTAPDAGISLGLMLRLINGSPGTFTLEHLWREHIAPRLEKFSAADRTGLKSAYDARYVRLLPRWDRTANGLSDRSRAMAGEQP